MIYLAVVPYGWARHADPKVALRNARQEGSAREPHVIYKVTGDDEPFVDEFGRVLANTGATCEVVEDTRKTTSSTQK